MSKTSKLYDEMKAYFDTFETEHEVDNKSDNKNIGLFSLS